MNNLSSIKYFEELKIKAKEDFERRFKDVSNRIIEDLLGDKPYHKDYQAVIGWMFELYNVNNTTFYSLFNKVMYKGTNLKTIEGLESMRSFVGNFFDDSVVKLAVDENRTYPTPNGPKQMEIDPVFDWHLEWAHDGDECLSTQQLIDIMQQVYEANYKWCQKCNSGFFGGDESTKLDKYDLSLLKKAE